MCNERERLIGYVYDECDSAERAAVQQHLESCAECRTEVTALRSVRADLQSWSVPDHESVWKPFAPAAAPSWFSQVPRWALAAAASLVLLSGAAGGAIAQSMLPQQPAVVTMTSPAGATQVSLTAADLAALERRIEGRLRQEMATLNQRVDLVSSRNGFFETQIASLRANGAKQLDLVGRINANMEQYEKGFNTRQAALNRRVENVLSLLEQGR